MWQRMAFVVTVVLLGLGGGVLALFVRGMHAERGAVAGFCVLSALAVVQAWLVASEIANARRLCGNIRNACHRGAQAKFRAVSLVGVCAIVGVLPMAWIGANSGAQGRFATVMLGGVVFSTIAALTVLPSSFHGSLSEIGSLLRFRYIGARSLRAQFVPSAMN